MGFWIFMLIAELLIPLMMLLFGKLFSKGTPKSINPVFGYRTRMSMKNQQTWDFAHQYMGRIWFVLGAALLPISIAVMLPVLGAGEDRIGNVGLWLVHIQLVLLIIPVFFTEKALRRKFDQEGRWKD